jgi:hypothetical protein
LIPLLNSAYNLRVPSANLSKLAIQVLVTKQKIKWLRLLYFITFTVLDGMNCDSYDL